MELKKIRMHLSKHQIKQAVSEVESGMSRREVCLKYGVSYGTLGEWLGKYGSEEYQATRKKVISGSKKREILIAIEQGNLTRHQASIAYKISVPTIRHWQRACQQEPQTASVAQQEPLHQGDLEKELAAAQLKIRALETLIDVAEDTLKIKIRKKPGAKQ